MSSMADAAAMSDNHSSTATADKSADSSRSHDDSAAKTASILPVATGGITCDSGPAPGLLVSASYGGATSDSSGASVNSANASYGGANAAGNGSASSILSAHVSLGGDTSRLSANISLGGDTFALASTIPHAVDISAPDAANNSNKEIIETNIVVTNGGDTSKIVISTEETKELEPVKNDSIVIDSIVIDSEIKESSQDTFGSEQHDSVAASAGSSPPPSSAAQDELQMDTDVKDESEGEKEESLEEKVEEEEDEKEEGEKIELKDEVAEEKKEPSEEPEKVEDQADAVESRAEKKRALPKWMVQDADAPPSPKEVEEEEVAHREESECASTEKVQSTTGRGRGRGKQGRGAGRTRKEVANEQSQPESLSSGRPRRSTRSNVDYAHPDVATVVAEQEDLENEIQQKVGRGRPRTRVARGGRAGLRRQKINDSEEGDDSGSEYGKRVKSSGGGGSVRGKARGGRGRSRGRPAGRSATARKDKKEDSDDEDEEMDLADDDVTGSNGSCDEDAGEGEAYKPAPSKRRAAPIASPNSKQPPKKRGRVAASKQD